MLLLLPVLPGVHRPKALWLTATVAALAVVLFLAERIGLSLLARGGTGHGLLVPLGQVLASLRAYGDPMVQSPWALWCGLLVHDGWLHLAVGLAGWLALAGAAELWLGSAGLGLFLLALAPASTLGLCAGLATTAAAGPGLVAPAAALGALLVATRAPSRLEVVLAWYQVTALGWRHLAMIAPGLVLAVLLVAEGLRTWGQAAAGRPGQLLVAVAVGVAAMVITRRA